MSDASHDPRRGAHGLLNRAIIFAIDAHWEQKDKSGEPYIFHPLRVMNAVRHFGEVAQCVAILHDVVEDCEIGLDSIEELFGRAVRDGVDAVTRREHPRSVLTDTRTKEIYRVFILRAGRHPMGREVKIADIRDNLSRLDGLKPDEADFLRNRYTNALALLGAY